MSGGSGSSFHDLVFGAKDDKGVHGNGALAGFADHQWVHADDL